MPAADHRISSVAAMGQDSPTRRQVILVSDARAPVVWVVVQFAKKISQFGMRDLLVLT